MLIPLKGTNMKANNEIKRFVIRFCGKLVYWYASSADEAKLDFLKVHRHLKNEPVTVSRN